MLIATLVACASTSKQSGTGEYVDDSVITTKVVLLALTAGLFDPLPLDQMNDAERVLREAASGIPADVSERLETTQRLSDEDRETIIQIARKSPARFQAKPEPEERS
jgi:F-type H+-transporting ATPase subunit alpha